MTTLKKFLRRYTDLPSLIYLLSTKRITLLDPATWDDKNDSYFLQVYKKRLSLQSVLALCFTQSSESYHHWRVFAGGPSGVCISFKRDKLLAWIRKHDTVRTGNVRYLKIPDLRNSNLGVHSLPFVKRYPFEHETEFRIVLNSNKHLASFDIPISLSCIERITLSPWMNAAVCDRTKALLWTIEGCRNLSIVRSTLVSNEDWKSFAESVPMRKRHNTQRKSI